MPATSTPRRLALVVAATLVLAACSASSSGDSATGGSADAASVTPPTSPTSMAATSAGAPAEEPAVDPVVDEIAVAAKQRCIDSTRIFERRVDEEGFEFPDDDFEELSEEELEQILHPPVEYVDGVAAPDERPPLAPMVAFDPNTAPILELDLMIGNCIESGIVTEAELYGDEDEEGSDEEWCAELAEIPVDELREFAAEEGEDVVREEFEFCGLPNPLDA